MIRIRVIHRPPVPEVDGIRLDVFEPGGQYEMGNSLGSLFLAEGWGEPVSFGKPARVAPVRGFMTDEASVHPENLIREIRPPITTRRRSPT